MNKTILLALFALSPSAFAQQSSTTIYPGSGGSSGPVKFVRDGVNQNVIEDTSVPANNRPLPVALFSSTGVGAVDQGDAGSIAESWYTRITDGTDQMTVNASGEANVTASQNGTWNLNNITGTISLPTGASTSSLQTSGNASLSSIDTNIASMNGKVTAVDTGNVTVVSSALPSGASTSALQGTGNTSLGSIDTKTPALVSGRVPVDGSGVTQPVSAAALPLPSGASTSAKQPALGTAGAASADVITVQGVASMTPLKTDGSGVTQPVSGTVGVSGSVNIRTLTTSDSVKSYLFDGSGNGIYEGQQIMNASVPVVIASDQTPVTVTGAVTVSGTIDPTLPSGFSNAGSSISAQQSYTSSGANKWMIVQADPANTDSIRFGSISTSTTSGMALAPGQDSGLIPWGPTRTLYVAPVSGTQKVNITFIF